MLAPRSVVVDLEEEGAMLAQILAALVGDVIFGAVTARHRCFQDDMQRYLEGQGLVEPPTTPPPPSR
jgi:hypothetical protein